MNKIPTIILLALGLGASVAHAQTPIIQFNFNDSGTSTADSGSSTTGANFQSGGVATDLHSAAGAGVTGSSSDIAFNNTAATGMGTTSGGQALLTGQVSALENLESFTMVGWFNTDTGEEIGAQGTLFSMTASGAGFGLSGDTANPGNLDLTVNGTVIGGSGNFFSATSQWVFFAVTYDGTSTSSNVKMYEGTTSANATLVKTLSLNKGTEVSPSSALSIGQRVNGTDAFDGLLDDMAIYGSSTDNTGALSLAQIQDIRAADLVVPEPHTVALLFAGAGLLFLWRFRRFSARV